ncbi:hypothetical protein HMN09_01080900 [Mycena chlorophos]|uniref:Uncharacterized protein n=1 Tax=Mycena chlorophos TaxID=658473 RepID=A0A8H6W055_MYCCL|nr:hypothetical protein HMN09_01080900 [Mycena chlorophos]
MQERARGPCGCHQCTRGVEKPHMDWLAPGGRGSEKFITPGTMPTGTRPSPNTNIASPAASKIGDGNSSHRARVGDKIIGSAERVAGSATGNILLKEKGAQRQQGVL